MEQSIPNNDQILDLGKTITQELKLNQSNILGHWMSHFLSELIVKYENTTDSEEKEKLRKECCDLIMKIWNQKENVPFRHPTSGLNPILEILEIFKKQEHPVLPLLFSKRNRDIKSSTWVAFLKIVKESSKSIYNKVLLAMLSDKVLEVENEWVKKHGVFLTEEEKKLIQYLNYLKKQELKIVFDDIIEFNPEKLENLFVELSNLIQDQKEALNSLKKNLLK